MKATRSHPWEPWKEPAQARYFGVTVEVVQQFEHYSLIRRPDQLSCVVETRDLTLLPGGAQ
jgi:hypothetical protein